MSWGATRCNVVDVRGWPYTKSTGGPYVYRWFFNVDAIRLEAYEHHSSLAAVSFQRQRPQEERQTKRLACRGAGPQIAAASRSSCGDGKSTPRRVVVVPVAIGRMGHHVLCGRAPTSRCSVRVRVAESATERGARASCSACSTALRASRSFLRPAAVTSSK